MNVGDIVSRKSYNNDVWFKIQAIKEDIVILKGLYYRLIADAHISDIVRVSTRDGSDEENDEYNSGNSIFKKWYKNQYGVKENIEINKNYDNYDIKTYKKFGKVLHIDGDKMYLKECLRQYEKLGVPVIGISLEESAQPKMIMSLLQEHKPNIVVITGHDSLIKNYDKYEDLSIYKNSKYYVECVKIAREYNCNYDELVIFAGGCKSNYEAIMEAGANFASSPNRILIHVIDPVLVACKIAMTSIRDIIDVEAVIKSTLSGFSGVGGMETRGQCREVSPRF